mmetsp:Transcript_66568/g.108034  ORF Transcript_66568/g.108034 Transcript_66568/m.108034 type:complete len:92 (+) Transcript_66568:569-844(+)
MPTTHIHTRTHTQTPSIDTAALAKMHTCTRNIHAKNDTHTSTTLSLSHTHTYTTTHTNAGYTRVQFRLDTFRSAAKLMLKFGNHASVCMHL